MKYWLPVIAWAGAIFYGSSISSPNIPSYPNSDKLLHIIEYAFLGFLLSRLMRNAEYPFSRKKYFVYFLAMLIGLSYGVSDEIHQYFVPGRSCSLWDILADAIGAGIGACVYR